MCYIVRTPKRRAGTASGTLRSWAVDEGDSVERGETIARVEFESSADEAEPSGTAVEARDRGVLRRMYFDAGAAAPPGTPIGIVGPADADVAELEAEAAAELAEIVAEATAIPETGAEAGESTTDAVDTEMPARTLTAHNPEGVAGTIEAGSFRWRFDEPEAAGGSELGPTPVDVFLGGFAACLSLSVRFQANKREASVGAIDVTADAEPERGSVDRLAVTVELETDADAETVERIVDLGERGCHVSQLLREDLPLEVNWERT
ncbi:OsmC family protein [Halosolutus gelatinilyticus]|uniref:OsmC family protein n=1 Tax=Halosolutus gelatinilyticus TaxID=2931975 RepID=UPI001FF1EFAD|nr:OsmC family protein [Halosolutus gelatinilyticus]